MSMAAHNHGRWTPDLVREIPEDGNRYELVNGTLLVTPAPRHVHQRAVGLLYRVLHDFTVRHALGTTSFAPADIELSRETLVQPDVFVAPLLKGRVPREWSDMSSLLLAIEVLSPSTARADRHIKRHLYQRHEIEYWIVDLEARLIERWLPEDARPEICVEALTWRPGGQEELLIDLGAFIREVFDD
jgi:Uma2 family endonuclease